MEVDFAGLFFCSLCGQERPVNEVVPLDNCACLFCQSCVTTYLTQQLENLVQTEQRSAFYEHYCPRRTGTYVDDEGASQGATVVQAEFHEDWDTAEVILKLGNGTQVRSPYWRVTMSETSQLMSAFCSMGLVCPGEDCGGVITKSEAQELCPVDFGRLLEAETMVHARISGCIQCPYPECRCLIERLYPDVSQPGLAGERHGEQFRFRCAGCQGDFCGVCFARPYHAGFNCLEFKLPNCRYCNAKLAPAGASAVEARPSCSLHLNELKRVIKDAGLEYRWCLEKSDFVFAVERIKSVCQSGECRRLLSKACLKKLPCGHGCCGVKQNPNEHRCLPCFEPGCPHSSSEFDGCQICWESFASSPCIQLSCKHLIHLGPSISFNHLYCSMCGTAGRENGSVQIATSDCPLNHRLLKKEIQPILALREQTVALAMTRLKASNDIQAEVLPFCTGEEGHMCNVGAKTRGKCKKPYFGGLRDCQAAAGNAEEFNPQELVCGSCCALAAGQNCPRHGTAYIEWKCRYCCEIACWYCFGTTHFCDPCHRNLTQRTKPCKGADCPLKVPHPAPGHEFCLGCALCRHRHV